MLRVLFLAPRVPWPLDTGAKIRTYHLLRALARRHMVHALTLSDPANDEAGQRELARLGVACDVCPAPALPWRVLDLARGLIGPLPANVQKYQRGWLADRVAELVWRRAVDVVHADHLHMAPYGLLTQLPFVVDEHNVETVIWDRFARDRAEPLLKRALFLQQAFWLRRLEARLCRAAALVLLCSRVDEAVLRTLAGPLRATKVVPNGVDVDYFGAPGPRLDEGHLVFTGSMDWAPNENAVLAFLDEIWPVVRPRLGARRFVVVGRNPSARLRACARPGEVIVTGTVPDVRPHLRGARALVVPMRVGGGTRLKILEAFAAGVPVISTAVGIEGIDATAGTHYLAAETAGEFAARVAELESSPARRAELAAAAVRLARARYSWDAVGGELAAEYERRFD